MSDLNIPGFIGIDHMIPRPKPYPTGSGNLKVRLVEIDCQSEGARPNTALISFDLSASPEAAYEDPDEQYGAFWIEPTREELAALIANLQEVLDNFEYTPGYGGQP